MKKLYPLTLITCFIFVNCLAMELPSNGESSDYIGTSYKAEDRDYIVKDDAACLTEEETKQLDNLIGGWERSIKTYKIKPNGKKVLDEIYYISEDKDFISATMYKKNGIIGERYKGKFTCYLYDSGKVEQLSTKLEENRILTYKDDFLFKKLLKIIKKYKKQKDLDKIYITEKEKKEEEKALWKESEEEKLDWKKQAKLF